MWARLDSNQRPTDYESETAKSGEIGRERRISGTPCKRRSYPLLTDVTATDSLYPPWYPTVPASVPAPVPLEPSEAGGNPSAGA